MGGDDNTMPRPPVAQLPEGRPPAVLQVLPSLVSGGAERGTVELAAALTAAGWNAYVASAGGPLEREIARAGATHLTLPLASKNPLVMRRNRAALARAIHALGIDIVHARSRAPAWSAWSAAHATGRHFVTTFHNAYGAGSALKRWYNSVMARGERVIAISDFVADHAAKVYGVEPDRLRTIPRGVDLDIFDPRRVGGQRIASLARQWRLPDGVPTVMLPGRLTRWKGGLDFIAAIAALGRRDICCVLVGAEQRRGFRRELETAIERHKLVGLFRIVERLSGYGRRLYAGRCRRLGVERPRGFWADHRRSTGDGSAGGRHRSWRRPRDDRARCQPAGWCPRAIPPPSPRRSATALSLGSGRAVAACQARNLAHSGQLYPRSDVRPHDRGL